MVDVHPVDPAVGAWLVESGADAFGPDLRALAPAGYAASARILHPGQVRHLPDRAMPAVDEWPAIGSAEFDRIVADIVNEPIRWDAAARALGTARTPLSTWSEIVDDPEATYGAVIGADGREYSPGDEGSMAPELLALVARHLVEHTSTPDAGVAALWEGWGGLVGAAGGVGSAVFTSARPPGRLRSWLSLRFSPPFLPRRRRWHDGILSREVSEGPRLRLPGRDYITFAAPPRIFTDPTWTHDVPWRDPALEGRGWTPAVHPSLVWPHDRSWVLVSEIDLDSTVVAGSRALVDELCADPDIEALDIS